MISNFPILHQYKYPHAHVAFITARLSILYNGFSFRGELYAMQAGVGCFLPIHTNKDEKIQKKMKTHRSKDQYSISSGGHPALGS